LTVEPKDLEDEESLREDVVATVREDHDESVDSPHDAGMDDPGEPSRGEEDAAGAGTAEASGASDPPAPPTGTGLVFPAGLTAVSLATAVAVHAVVSGLVPTAIDPAWIAVGSCLGLALLLSWMFILWARALRKARDTDVAAALQRLGAGATSPIRDDDPLSQAFLDCVVAIAAETGERVAAGEESAKKESTRETIRVKSQCERLVERYAERLHREKKEAIAALDGLQAEHEQQRKAWEAGGATVERLRKEAEERCAMLESRVASLDKEVGAKADDCSRLAKEVDRLLQDVDKLRQQNVRFFDKVAAQLRGSLQIAGKLAAELTCDPKEKAGRGKGSQAERTEGEIAEEIRLRIARLERLVEQILDLSRIETSTLSLVYSEADVGVTLKRSCGDMRELAVAKTIDLSFKHPKGIPGVLTDARLLNRIVRELVSNAVRYTPRGGRVTATANVSSECPLDRPARGLEEDWLRVDVTDTGEGIRPEDVERIFTAFERGTDPQFTVSDANPGLGLTLARHYARILGGDILLQSEVGRGSVFSLVLPVKVCVTTHVS
jgi:signal transduction histidine kinase